MVNRGGTYGRMDGRTEGWMDGRTDVWKFTPVSYRTSTLWGRCPALTPLLQLITPSRALGPADHVQSLDDFLDVSPRKLATFAMVKKIPWLGIVKDIHMGLTYVKL